MAYIKGSAVTGAVAYQLRRKIYGTNGQPLYVNPFTKTTGKTKYNIPEYVDASGEFKPTLNYWVRTEMIDVNDLGNDDNSVCTIVNGDAYPNRLHVAFYTEKDNTKSFVHGDTLGTVTDHQTHISAEHIKEMAESKGAKYVVFCSDTQYEGCKELFVNHTNEVNYNLDDYAWGLEPGPNVLVVRAIGDGVNNADSPYSNEIEYEYTPSVTN